MSGFPRDTKQAPTALERTAKTAPQGAETAFFQFHECCRLKRVVERHRAGDERSPALRATLVATLVALREA
jgi:hypothetical protein